MATDFQLKVGLDTTKATIDQVNNDIETIAKAVKPVKLKTTISMKKEDFQNLLDAKAKTWKHPPQLKTSIVLDSNQDVAKDVSTKLSSLKKLPTIALNIDSTETSQNIGESLNKLTLPTIKVKADLDPTSLSTITKTLSSRLQLSVNLNGGRKNDVHGTGSTANQIPRSVAAKRTSVQNDLDSLLAKFGNLQGVSQATTKYVSKMANEINTLLGQTKRVDDFEEIETKLRRMQGLFERLFKRTELGSGVNELLRDYTSLEQILKRQGLEFTRLGERITAISSDLEQLGKTDNLQLLDVDDLARIVSAHDALKDFKQEVDLASQAAQQFNFERAQNQILSLSNRLDKLGAVSGQARSQVRDLSDLLSKMDDLKGATSFTTEDLQRIKEFNNALAHTTELVKNRELANASAKMHGGGFDLQSLSKSTLREVDALEAKLAKTSNVTNSWVRSLEQNLQSLRTSIRSASTAADFATIDNKLRQVADSIDLITSRSNDIGEFKTVLNAYSKLADDIHAANAEQSFLGDTILSYYDVLQKVIASSQNLDLIPDNELQEARDARDLIEDISRMMKQSFAGHGISKTYAPLTYNETAEHIKKDMEALRKIGRLDSDAFRGLQQALDDLEKLKHLDGIEVVTTEQAEAVNIFRASLSALSVQVKELKRLSGAEFFDTALIARFEDAKNDLKVFASENSKVLTDANFLAEFQRLSDATYWDFGGTKEGITRLTMEVERFKAEAKQAGLATKTFADELKLLVTSISLSNLISRVGNYADEVFRSAVENVRALDTAMVELKKVTDETSMAYASFYQNAKNQAQEVGATLSDTIQSTADFARLGYTLEESVELSKVSTIYKNVGDGFESVTESSEALISIIKAFNIEAKDAIQIADKLNKIGNENAISSGGLGRALQNSASALNEAGASMEEAMALISGANSVTQDPDKVGNAMRTIALRIRSTATELEEMGEDAIGAAESTSKLREKILALAGVDIMVDANNYKGIYQILQEIARVWEDISDVDQAALLELLAGKNRANVLAGLLNNFADADEALKDALNADGSALVENEKILNSIQGKINQFQAAWQGLSETVMNSEFLKSIIDQGTNVLKILDRLIDSAGMLSTTMATIGGIGAYAFFDSLPQDMNVSSWFKQGAGSLLENLKTELSLNDALKTQKMQAKALDALNNDSSKLRSFYNEVSKTYSGASIEVTSQAADNLKGMSDAALELANRIATNKMNQEEFNKRLDEFNNKGKVGISNLKGMTLASKAASVGLNILASAAVSVGVAIASMLIQKVITYLHDVVFTADKARQTMEEFENVANNLQTNEAEIQDLGARFEELSKKVSLTTEEEEEYAKINNRLKELIPDLAGYYDANHQFHATEIKDLEDINRLLKEHIALAKQNEVKTFIGSSGDGQTSPYEEDMRTIKALRNEKPKLDALMLQYHNSQKLGLPFNVSEAANSIGLMIGSLDELENKLQSNSINTEKIFEKWRLQILNGLAGDAEHWEQLPEEYQTAYEKAVSKISDINVFEEIFEMWLEPGSFQQKFGNKFADIIQSIIDEGTQQTTATTPPPPKKALTAGDIDIAPYVELDEAVESLGDAYVQFAEKSQVSLESLNNLKTTFGACGDEWDAFINTVSSGDSTLEDVKRATNDLASKYVQNKVALGQVNEATKNHITSMLEQIGVTNASAVVEHELAVSTAEAALAKYDAADGTKTLNDIVEEECALTGAEVELVNKLVQVLDVTDDVKLAAAQPDFRDMTADEVAMLIAEADKANLAAEAIARLNAIERDKRIVEDAYRTGNFTPETYEAEDRLASFYQEVEDYKKQVSEPVQVNIEWSDTYRDFRNSTASTADAISKEFEQMYDELQYLRDANLISEQEYLQKLYQLNEQYNKKNLATYRKYQLQIFQGIKSMLAGQINSQADSQISALESQRDATERRYDALIKAKEKEKEQKEKYYDDLIEAEQDRLDQLKEEWTVQDHLLKIEQARAALAAAQQQKTVRIYKEGEGFVWERDEEAVGAAQDDLNEAVKNYDRYNQEQEIKDRIDAIEEEKETVLEALEEEIEALEEAKDRALEAIDQQISAVQAWREEALAALEEVGLTLEDFLKFFEMFGIEVDEGLMKLIEDFVKMAQESGTNIDELTGKVKGLKTALSGLTNGEYAADLEATDGKANPETGNDDPVNTFEEFTEAVKLWKDETVAAIDEVNLKFEELLEHLDEFETKTEFLKTWQTEAMTALADLGLKLTDFLALLDQFDVRFDEDVPLWKDAILAALDEVSLKINDFFVLLDNFDTAIDEGLLSLVDSFANMAADSSSHIDLIIAKLQELSDALAALGNGEHVSGSTTSEGEGATDAGSDENDAFSTTGGNLFEAIIEQFRILNEETAKHLDLIKEKWYTTIEDIQLLLNNFKEDGLVMMQEAVAESILEIENQLTLFGEFLNQFSLEATEALQPLVDQFTKLFVGEVEHTYEDGSTEMLSWIDYYKVMIDEIIKKHDEWWEYIIEYLEFVEEAHEWLNKVLEEQIEKVEEWKTELIEDMDELILKLEELASTAEDVSNRVSESFNAMSEAVQSAASEISEACSSIASAINSLPDGKTITITTVYRTVYETVGSPSAAPSKSGNRTVVERVNADNSVDNNTSPSSSPSTNMSAGVGYKDGDEWVNADGTIISGKWASGTLSVPTTGMALTDEEGPEIRIPGKGTFRKLHYGDAILPADVSRNLWMIGAKPVSFAKGIANMISNKTDDKRQNVFHFGDIHLPNVQNAQNFADEFKDIVMKATQLAYSK